MKHITSLLETQAGECYVRYASVIRGKNQRARNNVSSNLKYLTFLSSVLHCKLLLTSFIDYRLFSFL
jgi:hypothetical protein